MKTAKRALTFVILSALTFSCGNDKSNKVNSNNLVNGNNQINAGPNNGPQFNEPQWTSEQRSIVQAYKANTPCQSGTRLTQTVTFSVASQAQSGFSPTTIGGTFSATSFPNQVNNIFIGVSSFGDIIVVSDAVAAGLVGYQVTLSMCSYQNSFNGFPYITDTRPIQQFQAPYGIVIDKEASCRHGFVDAAMRTVVGVPEITFTSQGFPITLPQGYFETTFFKGNCVQ